MWSFVCRVARTFLRSCRRYTRKTRRPLRSQTQKFPPNSLVLAYVRSFLPYAFDAHKAAGMNATSLHITIVSSPDQIGPAGNFFDNAPAPSVRSGDGSFSTLVVMALLAPQAPSVQPHTPAAPPRSTTRPIKTTTVHAPLVSLTLSPARTMTSFLNSNVDGGKTRMCCRCRSLVGTRMLRPSLTVPSL